MKYWDSSAIFMLLTSQMGSQNAIAIFNSDPEIATWWGSSVELASAAARLRRMGDINDSAYIDILSGIGPLLQFAAEVQPTEEVKQTAFRLIRTHELRAADSLQLAAALVWARHIPTGLEFVCMDTRLCTAAEKEGFTVLR